MEIKVEEWEYEGTPVAFEASINATMRTATPATKSPTTTTADWERRWR
jgi:hypothetical protein